MNLDSQVLQINIDDIIPNRFQPRLAFDEQGLKELSDSIKEHGIIQPLVLRKLGNKYEIIAGERRYKAATMAGLVSVPAVISNIDDNKSAEVALVENVQRRDLTPIEEARSYKNLLDKGYLTQEQLAKKMGLSQPAVANKLRLLNLDEEVQQALMNEKISERHARSLLTVDDKERQRYWLHRVITERLTVRQLDLELKKEKSETPNIVPVTEAMPNIEQIKSKAQDINPEKPRRSVESMMLPEKIMTEFSGALPIDVVNNEIPINPGDNKVEEQILPQPENKFFNFGTEEVANMDTGISIMPEESTFQIATPEPITINQTPASSELETLDLIPETLQPLTPPPTPQAFTEPIPTPTTAFSPTVDLPQPAATKPLLSDALNSLRTNINTLKTQGYNINTEELDFDTYYQINIKIDK